jgi:hypothetical protein
MLPFAYFFVGCLCVASFDESEFKLFGEDVKRHVLDRLLTTLTPATLTEAGYTLTERYLLRVHDKAGHIRVPSASAARSIDVRQVVVHQYAELNAACNFLWNVVLHNPKEAVGRSAIGLLNAFHQNLHRKHVYVQKFE